MVLRTKWINRVALSLVMGALGAALMSGASVRAEDDAENQTRSLEHTAVIEAPIEAVWAMYTNPEKMKQWMSPKVDIDLRVGGLIRTNYNPQGTFEDETTIHNEILSFETERMLSMRNVKAPARFPFADTLRDTWSVIYFEPLSARLTKVRMVGLGYSTDASADGTYNFFKSANQSLLNQLEAILEKEHGLNTSAGVDVTADASFELLSKWSVGTWKYEGEGPDGGPFVAESTIEHAGDGRSLVSRTWLTMGGRRFQHGDTLIFLDPETQQIRYVNVNEQGHVAEGFIHRSGEKAFFWDWNATAGDGSSSTRYRIVTTFEDDDSYRMVLRRAGAPDDAPAMIDIVYDRQ